MSTRRILHLSGIERRRSIGGVHGGVGGANTLCCGTGATTTQDIEVLRCGQRVLHPADTSCQRLNIS
jgi:hypothetical protein